MGVAHVVSRQSNVSAASVKGGSEVDLRMLVGNGLLNQNNDFDSSHLGPEPLGLNTLALDPRLPRVLFVRAGDRLQRIVC